MGARPDIDVRVPLTGPVRFWSWNEPVFAEAVDISSSGIFVKTPALVPEGRHITLRIELPGRRAFTVLGKVVRTVRGGVLAVAGMGVRFLDLLPSQREALQGFVAQRALVGALR
ncbi:MAG: PilZ domain-containing protein [Archangium sp.]|nr:PilZ domain-containing protein [Archangium sp.]